MKGAAPARCALLVMAALLLGAACAPAEAKSRRYAVSHASYRQVGRYDARLSLACRHQRFNQARRHRLYIGYVGPKGRGTTGIAKLGWNLHDPQGLARHGVTYHFRNDGYSDCRVFTARRTR